MTPLDYYLWSAVKDKCYADKLETIDSLKDIIREAIGEIQLHTIDNVLKIWTDCVGYCVAIGNIWFQQDCAKRHTPEATLDIFEDRIISRRADVVWPPRSCTQSIMCLKIGPIV